MKKNNRGWSIIILLGGLSIQPLLAQEATLKDFAETRYDHKFAFYPSTLRMINVGKNEAYSEMVSSIDKLLIYSLDSTSRAEKSYHQLAQQYLDTGFEEYAMAYGNDMQMAILGKTDDRNSEWAGYLGMSDDLVVAFHLRGAIAWQKIPVLIRTMQQDDLLNFFELNKKQH